MYYVLHPCTGQIDDAYPTACIFMTWANNSTDTWLILCVLIRSQWANTTSIRALSFFFCFFSHLNTLWRRRAFGRDYNQWMQWSDLRIAQKISKAFIGNCRKRFARTKGEIDKRILWFRRKMWFWRKLIKLCTESKCHQCEKLAENPKVYVSAE